MKLTDKKAVTIETKFDIKALTKIEAMRELIKKLENKGFVTNHKGFMEDVIKREDTLPTYIGHGIGLPHSKSEFVRRPAVIVGRLKNNIIWNDNNKVCLIFLIAVPKKSNGNLHLKILANLARMLMHDDFRNKLLKLNEKEVQQLMYASMDLNKGGNTNE